MHINPPRAAGLGLGLICLAALLTSGAEPSAQVAAANRRSAPEKLPAAKSPHPSLVVHHFAGVGSCASAGCHGGAGSAGTPGSEYSIWIQQDPHARAYSTLFEPLSQQMADKLKLGPAHQAAVCLACHSSHSANGSPTPDEQFSLSDGVGCESCHGPAEKWLEPHKRADWQTLSSEAKSALGFWNTDDLLTRTRICASCHVGSPGRDVNHDLIAAGHPPLKFEMAVYHDRMPRHWSARKDRDRNSPALTARLWAIGQAASAEMSLRLLEHRASPQNPVWPEFAEYGCFACHHDLQPESWRQNRMDANRRPGELAWGSWYTPLLSSLARRTDGIDAEKLQASLDRLRQALGSPYGGRSPELAAQAGATARLLGDWAAALNQRKFREGDLRMLSAGLAADGQPISAINWDAATQVYLGLTAIDRGRARIAAGEGLSSERAERAQLLEQMRRSLVFPAPDDGVRYDSPRDFGPDSTSDIQNTLHRIQQLNEAGQ